MNKIRIYIIIFILIIFCYSFIENTEKNDTSVFWNGAIPNGDYTAFWNGSSNGNYQV